MPAEQQRRLLGIYMGLRHHNAPNSLLFGAPAMMLGERCLWDIPLLWPLVVMNVEPRGIVGDTGDD